MANIKIANTILLRHVEGGLSKAKTDTESRYPIPDGSGYHTNKGITWRTFKKMAATCGYIASVEAFYRMPKNIWLCIYKKGYWDQMYGDAIKSQAIAEFIVDWAFNSGEDDPSREIQRLLKIKVDSKWGPKTTKALNTRIRQYGERKVFEELVLSRLQFYRSLSTWDANKGGWTRRVQKLSKYASSIMGKPTFKLGAAFFFLLHLELFFTMI